MRPAVKSKPTIIVTTSWDDGHVLDLKLAELLTKYGLRGTFYIAPDNHEIAPAKRLTAAQIKDLSQKFEIGAHTLTHPRLPEVGDATAAHEIRGSKLALEAIIGRPVVTFCYPGGEYRGAHLAMVQQAGFHYARTVERFRFALGRDRLTAPTSIHAYRHWSDAAAILKFARFNPVRGLHYLLNWDALAIAMFDQTAVRGGVFHIWGHSWEIDARSDWQRLENVFDHISHQPGVKYLTNEALS